MNAPNHYERFVVLKAPKSNYLFSQSSILLFSFFHFFHFLILFFPFNFGKKKTGFLMKGTRRSSMRHPSPSRDRSTLSATSSACTPVLLPPCSHFPVSPRNPNFSLFFMFFRQLHRDPNVLFAEYKLLHPLQYKIIVRVCDMDAMLSSVFSGYCAPYSPAKFFIQVCIW